MSEKSVRGQETFRDFARANGPAIAEQVRKERLEASGTEAALAHEDRVIEAAKRIDELDEMQIAQELEGRVISQYFYEFETRGRTVTGISISGVKAIARHMALRGEPISIVGQIWDSGEDGDGAWIGCTVRAKDLLTGEERFAYSSQYLEMKLKDGRRIPDSFARTKCLNKAERNALRWFVPEVVVIQMYKAWKEGKPLKEALEGAAKAEARRPAEARA